MDKEFDYDSNKDKCIVMYLYSMELGNPPLYNVVNKVCKTLDKNYLQSLGPFVAALTWSTSSLGEKTKDPSDKISGSFLLFRGV